MDVFRFMESNGSEFWLSSPDGRFNSHRDGGVVGLHIRPEKKIRKQTDDWALRRKHIRLSSANSEK